MSSLTDFKNALQSLTTTVVKAEAAREGSDDAAFAELRTLGLVQWLELRALQAAFVAELLETDPEATVPHATWLVSTVARAEALFGPAPAGGDPP